MKKLRNNKIRKLLAFMVALALMVSCMPSAYTISASEAFGDGTDDIFTDGEFTSEPAAEESTPDVSSADQEELEQAQQTTLTYENDSVKVTAEAVDEGALPQNTTLRADGLSDSSSVSYDTAAQKLTAAAENKGSSLRGFFAYDVYFADANGSRVEPNGRIRVTFEYKTPAAPELTDAASTSVTVEKLHYNSSTGDTDVNTLQANEDLKVLNVNEGKQIQTLQVETGSAAVFAVMWDSPETAEVNEEAVTENTEDVSDNADEVSIASEEFSDVSDISDEPEQDAAETPAAEESEVTPDAEPTEEPTVEPTEAPAAEPTEAPAEEEPAEDIESPDDVPEADENGETSLIEVVADETNLRVSPSTEAEILATVNAGTQLTLLDTVTAEDGATWYKVSYEETEAYIRSDMAQIVGTDEEVPEDIQEETEELEPEEVTYTKTIDNVEVTATANRGVLPEDAELVVNPIEKEDVQYSEVEAQLNEKAEKESYTIAGFLAYDIYFQDSEGNKLEPQDGSVKVSMAYKEAEIPDSVAETEETQDSSMNIAVMHLVEDKDGNVTNVVDMSNEGQAEVNTTDNGEIESAKFETESFSAFSIVWQSASDLISTQAGFSTIDTVDSKSAGITINMFDYEMNKITSGKTLEFRNATNGQAGYNIWTGDLTNKSDANGHRFSSTKDTAKKTPYQGIMQKLLGSSGYPVLNVGKKEDTAYLFSTTNNGGSVYSDLNKLFTKDSDGYYEYDSAKNYAYLNGSNFEVYNVTGTSSAANGTSGGQNMGGFFPFNPLAQNSTALTQGSSIRNIETGTGHKDANYHFGMTMSANFMQPENGNVNNKAMKFEFSGDDDVWVYIDGVLVLDIGGLHDAVSGSIDFATGEVKVDNETSTNLKALFEAAGKSTATGFKGNTFSNYTKHTINFYYLERGAGASNCHLKFNLTTVPEGTVAVEKKLSNTDKEKYANVDFKFQLLAQKITGKDSNGNDTYSDKYVPVAVGDNGVTASLNDGTALAASDFKTETINNQEYEKVFTLKPGQKATFAGLKKDRKYKVVELGVKSDEYDQVTINDVVKSDQSGNITSDEATVGDRPWVVFTNNCSLYNRRELRITKKIKNEVSVGDDTFSFKILLSDQNNELSPYANGDYYLTDEDGNYWYYNPAGALTSNEKTPIVCGKTSAEGIVTGVQDGWTVSVTQILSGTSFFVEEVNLDGTKYNTPEKTVKNTDNSVIEPSAISGADGKITLKKDALVTVTNDPKNSDSAADETFIKVSKTFNGLTAEQIGELASADPAYKISVTGTKKDSSTGTSSGFTQDLYLKDAKAEGKDTTWTYTWTIKGCGTGTYTVNESNYNKNGYTTNITINGTEVTDPEKNGVEVNTKASQYSYTEKERVTSCNNTDYEIGKQNLIVAKLTKGQGTFVWTRNPASINERLAIIELIKGINGFDNNASLDNCYFYSGEGIEGTLIFRNAKIKYDCENILHFDYPKQWAMFATGTYTITDGQNAEVEITNTYTEQTADIDLIKILNSTGSDETRLTGAEFDLYKKDGSSYIKVNTDPIVVDNDHQEEALKNLKTGLYYLEETKAPIGCVILNDRIYFKQENSTITLTDADGNEPQTDNVMWSLSSDNNRFVLKIKNNELYELPNSGGPGIYGFTISGVAILATALLLFINNKRREEEAKRS